MIRRRLGRLTRLLLVGVLSLASVSRADVQSQPLPSQAQPAGGYAWVTAAQPPAYACPDTQPRDGCLTPAVVNASRVYNGGEARTGPGGSEDLQTLTAIKFRLHERSRLLFQNVTNAADQLAIAIRHGAAQLLSSGLITINAGAVVVDNLPSPLPRSGRGAAPPPAPRRAPVAVTVEVRETPAGTAVYVAVPRRGGGVTVRLTTDPPAQLVLLPGMEILIPPPR